MRVTYIGCKCSYFSTRSIQEGKRKYVRDPQWSRQKRMRCIWVLRCRKGPRVDAPFFVFLQKSKRQNKQKCIAGENRKLYKELFSERDLMQQVFYYKSKQKMKATIMVNV